MTNQVNMTRLAINQATTRPQWPLAQAVDGYARCGVAGITVWFDSLRAAGVEVGGKLLRDAGLAVSGYCVAGDFSLAGDTGRRNMLAENKRMVDEAASIGAPCLVIIGGGIAAEQNDLQAARDRAFEAIAELLPHARSAGVTLALEPLHPMVCASRSVLCTMAQANDWCDSLGEGTGVAVDTYNVWWDPQLQSEIARAIGRVAAFHVADWLADTTDLRLDRGMPGDGVIDLRLIRRWVEDAGYTGFVEVEVFSERNWWRRPGDEVAATVVERWRSGRF